MIKTVLSTALVLALCTVAQAAPSATIRQAGVASSGHGYWLSEGLNRLVFWRPPAQAGKKATR